MSRVKSGKTRRQKHKKTLKAAKGYRLTYSKLYRRASEALLHAGQYAYNDRRKRKKQMRQLWIMRINAALKELGYKYKDFVHKAKKVEVVIDRKILAELAVNNPEVFKAVAEKVMK